jgi:transcriptional regulator with XRE-family HTH domain
MDATPESTRSDDDVSHLSAPAEASSAVELGRRVSALRHERGLTIVQLASAAGISSGLVSQIERGHGNPAYLTLMKLAHALGSPVTAFFPDDLDPADRLIVRHDERRRLTSIEDDGVSVEIITPTIHGNLLAGWVEIPAGGQLPETALNAITERSESLIVMSGTLVVTVLGDEHRLTVGDTITFDPYRVRTIAASDDAPAAFVQVVVRNRPSA